MLLWLLSLELEVVHFKEDKCVFKSIWKVAYFPHFVLGLIHLLSAEQLQNSGPLNLHMQIG